MNTPICIASKGRANTKALNDLYLINSINVFLFVEPSEVKIYKYYYPAWEIIDIGTTDKGLAVVRNFILNTAKKFWEYYWLLDDDVSGFYVREGAKMIKTNLNSVLPNAEQQFIENKIVHGGLEYRQFSWCANKPLNKRTFCDTVVWFDVKNIPLVRYRTELPVKVDRDFCMQVVHAGGATARTTLYAFACPPNGSNKGGLKELVYDKQDGEEQAVDALIKLWGNNIVKKIIKKTGRIDAEINWAALGNTNQQTINDIFGI